MTKLWPVLATTLTVTAIILSSGAAYAQVAHQMQVQRTESAELLKVHATVHATMEACDRSPSVPPFVFVPPIKGTASILASTRTGLSSHRRRRASRSASRRRSQAAGVDRGR